MRDNLNVIVVGKQRIGKTTFTRDEYIEAYCRGFKVLIFDPNDEIKLKYFSGSELLAAAKRVAKNLGPQAIKCDLSEAKANPNKLFYIPRVAYNCHEEDTSKRVEQIKKYGKLKGCGIRRISPLLNAKAVDEGKTLSKEFMSIEAKLRAAKDILAHFRPTDAGLRNGFVFLDDINNYVISMHGDQEFVGTLMNINHRGVDVVVHYHDVMQVPPVLYRFGGYIRLHKTVNEIKPADKFPYEILKISECIVAEEFANNERFFLYVNPAEGKIMRATPKQFEAGARKFLRIEPKFMRMYGKNEVEAIEAMKKKYL